jgi:hypothetical protein
MYAAGFASGGDCCVERDPDVGLGFAVEFYQAHHDFVAQFRLLQCQNSNPWVGDLEQRKLLAQRSRVLCRFKGDQRSVQALRLPVGLALAPASGMPGDSVNELVMSDILRALICITSARARSTDER